MRIVKERINIRTEEYVSESQAAAMLQLAVGTLRNLRYAEGFIPHIRGERRKVFYKRDDVIAFRDKPKKFRLEHAYPRIPVLFNDTPISDIDPLTKLTTTESAITFGISKASLQIWRSKHQFLDVLPFQGSGLGIYYLAGDLASFVMNGREYWKARSAELNYQFRPHPRAYWAA
ncbi:TPA: hypothetical protein ACPWGP_003384 [Pseudomonas aeruginosa]|nr:hypothetical protein [Pseudomonas aeruginosa]